MKKRIKELSILNSTITDLMKKNQNKTRGVVFNSKLFPLQTKPTSVFSNNIFLEKNKKASFKISSLSRTFSSNLVKEQKNLRRALYTMPRKLSANSVPFFNRSFDKKRLKMLFSWYYANRGEAATFSLVETLQKLGFTYAMQAGISLGVDDLKVPLTKGESLTEAVELLTSTKTSVNSGNVTALEEFQQFVDTWHRTSENLKTSVVQNFSRSSLNLLKKTNVTPSSSVLSDKEENSKMPLLDLRNKKNKEIERSSIEQLHPYEKKNSFSLKIRAKNKEKGPVNFNEKQHNQKQKPFASYSTILNPVYMMAFSGARGNLSQVRQLVGIRGLMADPQGQLVEFPIQSNFREGLTVTEYMISCYGARKGLVDTALRTAAAGYLTRRLVDVSHHQIVRFVTCGTKNGVLLYNKDKKKEENKNTLLPSAWKVSPSLKVTFKQQQSNNTSTLYTRESAAHLANNSLKNPSLTNQTVKSPKVLQQITQAKEKKVPLVFCVGRVLARDIPGYAFRNQEIDISLASSSALKKVYDTIGIYIRSPLTCKAETGICQLCYGWSISANRLVGLGEAVGIIAAQSIGEPGTQLTMRTFHTGGVFYGDIMEECRAKHAGTIFFQKIYLGLLVRTAGGAIAFCLKTAATFQIKGANEMTTYTVSANTLLFVRQGEKVTKDTLLAQIPNLPTVEENTGFATKTIVSDLSGEVRQKATVNPELASIRILAGQECKQFYFFNFFDVFARQNQQSTISKYLKKHLLSTNALNTRAPITEKPKYLQKDEHLLAFEQANKQKQKLRELKKTKGLVKLILGAHRLGSNETFSLSINGSKTEVVLVDHKPMKHKTSLQEVYLTNNVNRKLSYARGLASSPAEVTKALNTRKYLDSIIKVDCLKSSTFFKNEQFYNANVPNFVKVELLTDLRFFIASNLHQNKFATSLLFRNSDVELLSNNFTILRKVELGLPWPLGPSRAVALRAKPSKSKNTSNYRTIASAVFLVHNQKLKEKKQFLRLDLFHLASKAKTFSDQSNNFFYLRNVTHAHFLKLKKFFLSSKTPKQMPLSFGLELSTVDSLASTSLDTGSHTLLKNTPAGPWRGSSWRGPVGQAGLQPSGQKETTRLGLKLLDKKILIDKTSHFTNQVSRKCLKVKNNKKTGVTLNNLTTVRIWPETISPKILDYASLFWKLEDLLFFRSCFTKKINIFSQLRISTNLQWWGVNKSKRYKKDILIKSKGFTRVHFLRESKKTSPIKKFPSLLCKLVFRFNKKKSLKNFEPGELQTGKVLTDSLMSFNDLKTTSIKPRIKYQESGEVFPLQGNINVKEFQKNFRSCQNAKPLNNGLLTHYNRISYKIALCDISKNASLSLDQTNNFNSTKARLSLLQSQLAVFTLPDFMAPVSSSSATSLDYAQVANQKQLEPNRNNKISLNSQSNFNPSIFDKIFLAKPILVPQIGNFINTGDEIIKDCASGYCGQIIEKSPVGLTLRLTQNILYSNLQNRPAKISTNVKDSNWIGKGAPLVTLPYISNVTGDIVAGIPKIEQLFEARGEALDETVEQMWMSIKFSIVPRAKAVRECFKEVGLFVVAAIQKVYSSQGVHIADKHLEVIIRQMTRRALIVDPGDTEFLPDEFVDLTTIECVNWATYGDNALYRPRLIGITKASLTSNSFLSSASFQQTARVLERETVLEKTDRLLGLKERVMMGAIINAGTGELKTSVRLSDRTLAKSLSPKLIQRLGFFSRRKIKITKKIN